MESPADIGCWCFMPYKTRLKYVDCWLWLEAGGEYVDEIGGWPNELNGTYIHEQYESRTRERA